MTDEQESREPSVEDLVDLCRHLNAAGARYVVVGGFAMRAAGYDRRTMDIDLLIDPELENEARVYDALAYLPDEAVRELKPGEVSQYSVVRVADEIVGIMPGSGYFRFNVGGQDALEEALEALRERGFSPARPQLLGNVQADADGTVATLREVAIDRTILRAVAKIAFNCFAYQYPSLARTHNSAEIRRFIRYGDWPPESPVSLSDEPIVAGVPPERQLLVHAIALTWDVHTRVIRAQLSLLSVRQYQLAVAHEFLIPPASVECGHAFDPSGHRIMPLGRVRTLADLRPPPMAATPEDD
jgi:hypothetical protein